MSQWPPDREPVEWLACEFASRLRRGECPAVWEYQTRYPEYARQIEDFFPIIAMLERLRFQEAARS